MKDKIFGVLQRVGRSFMLPIAILPVAGLFLGVGGSFTNETMLETYGLMGLMGPGTFINAILQVLNAAGSVVFDNLPLIFAIGVAIGMAKQEKEVSALSAVIAFFVMHATIGAMIGDFGAPDLSGATASVLGINSLPVSYTHLDVYKRQDRGSALRSASRWATKQRGGITIHIASSAMAKWTKARFGKRCCSRRSSG